MSSDASDKKSPSWTILKVIDWTESYFKSFKIDSPRLAAEMLLCHCLGITRLNLYLQYDRPLNKKELSSYKSLISRRVQREPVAYITGNKGFWESEFSVTPCVLIPRPDTEILVEKCLEIMGKSDHKKKVMKILDLGSGSGAVIISLARACPSNAYFALDISPAAAKSTARNALKILKKNKIFILVGSWFSPLKNRQGFDLIISNPPYIPSKEIDILQPEIKNYEPRLALDGGDDGLDAIREILAHAWEFLNPGGFLLLETGCDQKKNVEKIADNYASYDFVKYIKDYSDHNRVAVFRRNKFS